MKSMSAVEFRARCLKVMGEVRTTRETIVITKWGRPVAKLVPAEQPSGQVFGCLAGKLEITGDIEPPAVPLEAWKVLK